MAFEILLVFGLILLAMILFAVFHFHVRWRLYVT
jgi:hypothetical protein